MPWTAKASFPNAAGIMEHSMTYLANGKILISGGASLTAQFDETAEPHCYLYNPATNTYTQTGDLNELRVNSHTVTLSNGLILTIGGRGRVIDGPGIASCELYNINTGLWTTTGSMTHSRYGYGVWVLNSGNIMVAGGNGGPDIGIVQRKSTEIYDVANGTWSNPSHDLPETIEWPYFFSLDDGTPICAGGNNSNGTISVYKYNTSTGWSLDTTYPISGFNGTSEDPFGRNIRLNNGKWLLCATNYSTTNKFAPTRKCFLYDGTAHTMTECGNLNTARTYSFQIATSDGGAFVAGGLNSDATADVESVEKYNVLTDSWSITSDNMPSWYSIHTFVKAGNAWYVLGGEIDNGPTTPLMLAFTESNVNVMSLSDAKSQWFAAKGYVSNSLNDQMKRYLSANGGGDSNYLNRLWYQFLSSKGRTGSLNDMYRAELIASVPNSHSGMSITDLEKLFYSNTTNEFL